MAGLDDGLAVADHAEVVDEARAGLGGVEVTHGQFNSPMEAARFREKIISSTFRCLGSYHRVPKSVFELAVVDHTKG